jgi:hypothetical protein
MTLSSDPRLENVLPPTSSRFTAWPLWASLAGLLGVVSTLITDKRAGDTSDMDYTVSVKDIAPLDHELFRLGGLSGYVCVAVLLIFAAIWHRRVSQRFGWSLGAPIVTFGLIASAAALSLAYGWKGALGNYLHGAAESGAYDDQGLYTYYVMNDFSPYIGWYPILVAAGGLAWMAFREGLVSRVLGGLSAALVVLVFGAVAITGVPGLPVASMLGLLIAGIWLAVGRSAITSEGDS